MGALKRMYVVAVVVCIIISGGFVDKGNCASPSPSPSVDCSSLILNLADCLSYVSNGSTTTKPEASCCSGLKTVLKTDAECLCEGFKSSAQLGVVLNITKAITLPSACGVSAPSITNCGLSAVPGAAPAQSPSSPTSPITTAGAGEPTSAPGPASSGSALLLSLSVPSLVAGLLVASFSCF